MPKVRVATPTYNQAQFIAEIIQSVFGQSFQDLEIIVIDDGSTDNTPERISTFAVRYFRHENHEVAAAGNCGIGLSRGEHIAFLDFDDAARRRSEERKEKEP